MRVINKPRDSCKIVTCKCGAEIEYFPHDKHDGAFGCMYLTCPECANEVLLDKEDPIKLTIDNVEWPKHFDLPDGSEMNFDDATIQKWVRMCLSQLSSDIYKVRDVVSMGSGNTRIWAEKWEEEYAVYVTKSFSTTSIPREDIITELR